MEKYFHFDQGPFNRLFPFFILIDKDLRIKNCGDSIKELCGIENNMLLTDVFILKKPAIKIEVFENLLNLENQQVVLKYKGDKNTILKGQFEVLNEELKVLFIGSPSFTALDETEKESEELTLHDPVFELLKILKTQKSLNYDIKQLFVTLHHQKNDLKRLSLIAEETNNAVIVTDAQGKTEWVNKAFENISGYSLAEIKGKIPGNLLQGKDTDKSTVEYLRNQVNNNLPFTCDILNYRKNGEPYWIKINGQPLFDKKGKTLQFFAIEEDITESKLQDSERKKIEEELRKAKLETEIVAKGKEQFLANMSHEIRTPLNGIIGISELLSKTPLNEQQQEYIKIILDSSNNLQVIVNDILDLEKIAAGKLRLEKIPFDIAEKVRLTTEAYQYKTEEKEILLFLENLLPAELTVTGDPYRLSQILNNMLSNAVKFTHNGYVKISVAMTRTSANTVDIHFTIQDTGIGISKDKLVRLFQPFEQGGAEISRQFGGTGLGLAICKNLVEIQGGRIEAASEKGKGSTFVFSIPYELAEKKEVAPPDFWEANTLNLKNLVILVVEDVEVNQYLLLHVLKSRGCEVVFAKNGREAVNMVKKFAYDLILMDIQMPVMDGVEATRQIRLLTDPKKSGVPIIALTANVLHGDNEKYRSQGMNGYVLKPFNENQLLQTIHAVLHHEDFQHKTPEGILDRGLMLSNSGNLPGKQTGNHEGNKTGNQTGNHEGCPYTPLYSLDILREMSQGDEFFLKNMVRLILDTVPSILREIETGRDAGQWEVVFKATHKLKPMIDTIKIESLTKEVRFIEHNLRNKANLEEMPGKIDFLVSRMREVVDNLSI